MTQEELVAQIEQDIEQKGSAQVPMGVIQEVFFADTHDLTTLDAVLEEFASQHGWHARHNDAWPTSRVIFYPVVGRGEVFRQGEK